MQGGTVAKFGGSSVKDATAMLRCASIIEKDFEITIVIVSATYQTTNQLENVANLASNGDVKGALEFYTTIQERHFTIAKDLGVLESARPAMAEVFAEITPLVKGIAMTGECVPKIMDKIYSVGERISSIIFFELLKAKLKGVRDTHLIDARTIIKTNDEFKRADPLIDEIERSAKSVLAPLLKSRKNLIVSQGFIGSTLEGDITTLGREGSDFSAALFAEAVRASKLQIWTDIPGMATIDPKVMPEAQIIPKLNYEEATIMAGLGAKILFPKTLLPAMRHDTAVFVGSSIEPEKGGTWITKGDNPKPALRALAVLEKLEQLNITDLNLFPAKDFGHRVTDILYNYKVPYDFMNYSGRVINVLVHKGEVDRFGKKSKDNYAEAINEISAFAKVEKSVDVALLSVIGNRMDECPERIAKILNSFYTHSIRILQMGGCPNSLSLLVHSSSKMQGLKVLYSFLDTV